MIELTYSKIISNESEDAVGCFKESGEVADGDGIEGLRVFIGSAPVAFELDHVALQEAHILVFVLLCCNFELEG
jgi:hypothetical protein